MNQQELKETFRSGAPVDYEDVEYACISALIYRKSGNKVILQAELSDKNTNSVTIARPDRVELAESGVIHNA